MTVRYRSPEELAQRIAELRSSAGVSQRQLGDVLGVDGSTVSRIESAERAVSVGELVGLADYFGVALDDLVRADAPPFWEWAAADDPGVRAAVEEMRQVIDDFRVLEAAARQS